MKKLLIALVKFYRSYIAPYAAQLPIYPNMFPVRA